MFSRLVALIQFLPGFCMNFIVNIYQLPQYISCLINKIDNVAVRKLIVEIVFIQSWYKMLHFLSQYQC